MGPSSVMLSKAHDGVVPRVAQTCKTQALRSLWQVNDSELADVALCKEYTGCCSVAMRLEAGIFGLQKKG